jgi:hypothetical protein
MARGGSPADPHQAEEILARLALLDPDSVAMSAGRAYTPIHRRMLYAAVLARAGARDSALAVASSETGRADSNDEFVASILYDDAHVHLFAGDAPGAARRIQILLQRRPQMRRFVRHDHLFRSLTP